MKKIPIINVTEKFIKDWDKQKKKQTAYNLTQFKKYHTKYCTCCGRKSTDIMKELLKQPFINGRQTWKGHTHSKGNNFFYDTNDLEFCGKCGKRLEDEDIKGHNEFMGMLGSSRTSQFIVTGYKCSKCGYEASF